VSEKGHLAFLQVKNSKALCLKEFIEDMLKGIPGGVHVILTGTYPNGTHLVAIGYHYLQKTIFAVVGHCDAGSMAPGMPYEMKYTDDHGHPGVISLFFKDSNLIDMHN